MNLTINLDDSDFVKGNARIRAIAGFLLHAIGDLDENETAVTVPTGTTAVETPAHRAPPPPPPAPLVVTAPASATSAAPAAGNVPPPPTTPAPGTASDDDEGEPPSNVTPLFPNGAPPPPPPPAPTANTAGAPLPPTMPPAQSAAGASSVASAEVDSAGMPYDGRIHQKGKGKKKDGTWKLIKGVDSTLVATVTAELAARKANTAPAPSAGLLPLPLPPQPSGAAATGVPAPPVPPSVPVPPSPGSMAGSGGAGGMGASDITAYRSLIDKITTATRAGKLTPQKVAELCQINGAPNLMELNKMSALIPLVEASIDAILNGCA